MEQPYSDKFEILQQSAARLLNRKDGAVKRKSCFAGYTQCQYEDCNKIWLDKIYEDQLPHRVKCLHCGRQQYIEGKKGLTFPVIIDKDQLEDLKLWGFYRDVAAGNSLGNHMTISKDSLPPEIVEQAYNLPKGFLKNPKRFKKADQIKKDS